MPAILLTRPRAASDKLAKQLRKLGYDCVIEPLLTIVPTQAPSPDFSAIKAVMLTSAHALDFLGKETKPLLALPCYCVGTATAERAREFGFRAVLDAQGDGAALARLIASRTVGAITDILYIAGRDIAGTTQNDLRRAGFAIDVWPVYAANASAGLSPSTRALLEQGGLDAVLLYSARSAETLGRLLVQHSLEACCDRLIALGISKAVTERIAHLPWRKLAAAPAPAESDLLALLQTSVPVA